MKGKVTEVVKLVEKLEREYTLTLSREELAQILFIMGNMSPKRFKEILLTVSDPLNFTHYTSEYKLITEEMGKYDYSLYGDMMNLYLSKQDEQQ